MAKTYTKAPDDVRDMCVGLMQRNHPKLAEFQLRVDVVFVATDSETANALSCGGYPAQAVVRILDSKQRAMGRGDAEITIDKENWLALTAREQMALLDHELYHITLRGGKSPIDEHGRPKLRLRKHDHQFGWFSEIAERWGEDSAEVKQAQQLIRAGRQTYFAFMGGEPAHKQAAA